MPKFSLRHLFATMFLLALVAAICRQMGRSATGPLVALGIIGFPLIAFYLTSMFRWSDGHLQLRVILGLCALLLVGLTVYAWIQNRTPPNLMAIFEIASGVGIMIAVVASLFWIPQFLVILKYRDATHGAKRLAELRQRRFQPLVIEDAEDTEDADHMADVTADESEEQFEEGEGAE